MRILLASSEVQPYSKTGGLGDMVGALGKALAEDGHQVGIVTPLYRGIARRFPEITKFDWRMDLPFGSGREVASVYVHQRKKNLTVYFIDKPDFFDRGGIYGETGWGYADNADRYIFFSKAVVHLARYLPWQPQLLHLHDWQTALVPSLVLEQQRRGGWAKPPKSVLTIHNLAYQGIFPPDKFALTNLDWEFWRPEAVEFFGSLNCLKAGLMHADYLTTVSPRYAREICTEQFGCGLDGVLRSRSHFLVGILNGVDYEEWNTTRNPHLTNPYSLRSLKGKLANKLALQQKLGLEVSPDIPLFGNVSRLVDQKGTDLLLTSLEEMLSKDMQFVFLGSGAPDLEKGAYDLARRHSNKKVAIRIGFDEPLSHQIEAACDFYLMPSRFEPCGLNQMYSLRYGAIPIVHRTGGLDDSVIDYRENAECANGIKFSEYSARALSHAIRKALELYRNKEALGTFRKNGISADFSWTRTSKIYEMIYQKALKVVR